MGTITTMSDTVAVLVIHEEPEEQESWAEVADPYTVAKAQDAHVEAHPEAYATDCVVILTAL